MGEKSPIISKKNEKKVLTNQIKYAIINTVEGAMANLNKMNEKEMRKMKITMFATMSEVRVFCSESGYPFHDVNLAQIYALYEMAGWRRAAIADHLGYAVSTVSTKRSQMWDYAELAEMLFGDAEIVEEVAVVVEPTTPYRKFKDGRPAVAMEFMPECGANIKGEEAVYFFKFYNAKALEFNKVGTSAKDVVARLRDEIGEYSKKFDIRRVEIHRIVSCGNRPAEGAESALRAELIRQYPQAFRKNDRFFGVDISPAVFDEIIHNYFG